MQEKTYHVGDLRNALLQNALEMLSEEGAGSISLRAVARRAGVSAMAPYRHYSDKNALLAAVAGAGYRELCTALKVADSQGPLRHRLAAQAVAYVQFAVHHPALFRLMSGPRLAGDHPELDASGKACYAVLRARVATGSLGGEALEERVLGAWCLMHGLASLMLDGKVVDKHQGSRDELATRVMQLMLDPDAGP